MLAATARLRRGQTVLKPTYNWFSRTSRESRKRIDELYFKVGKRQFETWNTNPCWGLGSFGTESPIIVRVYTNSIVLLHAISDPAYRRRSLTPLNRGEGRHRRTRVDFYGQRGELRQRYRQGQEDQRTALGLVVNAIIAWNTMDMQRALDHLRSTGPPVLAADVARLAPLGYAHLNLLGRDTFALPEPIAQGEWHPRNTTSQR